MTRPVQLFPIPAGTPRAGCRSCGQHIYWIVTASGRRMPVAVKPHLGEGFTGAIVPSDDADGTDGCGYSHFIDCPRADEHRKRGAP